MVVTGVVTLSIDHVILKLYEGKDSSQTVMYAYLSQRNIYSYFDNSYVRIIQIICSFINTPKVYKAILQHNFEQITPR